MRHKVSVCFHSEGIYSGKILLVKNSFMLAGPFNTTTLVWTCLVDLALAV